MSPERAGALATALSLSRVQRARLRAAFFNRWRATTLAAAVHATRRLLDPTPRAEPSPEAAIGALRRDLARLLVKDSALDESCIKAAAARASAKRRRRPLTPISPPPPPPSVQKENVSPGARRVKQLGRGIRRLYDAYATTHAKKLFPDAAVDLFRDCGVVPAYASADDIKTAVGAEPIDYDGSSAASTRRDFDVDRSRRCRAGGRWQRLGSHRLLQGRRRARPRVLLPRRRRRGRRPRLDACQGRRPAPRALPRDLVVEGVLRGAEAHRGALVNIKTYTRGRGQLPQLQFLPFSSWYFSSADFQPLG